MGRCITSLLILVTLFIPSEAFGSDQVRQVQEELRRRHLFHNHTDGHVTPALGHALRRYQARKGFEPTGTIDSETASSLGINGFAPPAPRVAAVHADGLERIGPNGEALPRRSSDEHDDELLHGAAAEHGYIEREIAYRALSSGWSGKAAEWGLLSTDSDDDAGAFDVDFELTNERLHRNAKPGAGIMLLLAGMDNAEWLSRRADEDRSGPATKPTRRSRPTAARGPRRRKETNPIVLAFQSVDRLMKNLFADDSRGRKKRPRPRRG